MSDDLEHRLQRIEADCGHFETLRCIYVRGHPGPCWSGAWEKWGGLSQRCYYPRKGFEGHACIRAKGHRGEHEGPEGQTWRSRSQGKE